MKRRKACQDETRHRAPTSYREPLNWKIISEMLDWFFYLSFTLIVLLVTV